MLMDIFFFVLITTLIFVGIWRLNTADKPTKELEKPESVVDNSTQTLLEATIAKNQELANQLGQAQYNIQVAEKQRDHNQATADLYAFQYRQEQEKNKEVVSQKISHAVRTADMIENIVPLLPNLPYNSKDMHHLGKPIDYLYLNYNGELGAEIVFVEVKTAKAKETPRQKALLKAIKEGRVHYDLLQIDNNQVKITRKT